jgi:hypothetical protein
MVSAAGVTSFGFTATSFMVLSESCAIMLSGSNSMSIKPNSNDFFMMNFCDENIFFQGKYLQLFVCVV